MRIDFECGRELPNRAESGDSVSGFDLRYGIPANPGLFR